MRRWIKALCLCLLLMTVTGCGEAQPEAVDYTVLTNETFAALSAEQKLTCASQFLAALSVQTRYPQETLDAAPGKTMGQMVQDAASISPTP